MCARDIRLICFFFQAEDGIRDLVRSRGLGDVYKRQTYTSSGFDLYPNPAEGSVFAVFKQEKSQSGTFTPVSYTHLTLPTSDLV